MDIKQRVKDILTAPAATWQIIARENTPAEEVIKQYLLPLLMLGSIAVFLGFGVVETSSTIPQGITLAIGHFLSNCAGILFLTIVILKLAPSFHSVANANNALRLVIYFLTPSLVGSVINVLPSLAWINTIFSLYGIYLLYLGLPVMLKTPENKQGAFVVLIVACTLILYYVLGRLIYHLIFMGFGVAGYR